MYITELPHNAIQLNVDGKHVVLMEYEQREMLMYFAKNHKGLFDQIVCPCCKER